MGGVSEPSPEPLARLLARAFTSLIDDLHARLAARGVEDMRPAYGYVLVNARTSPLRVTDVARVLGVTKQAASQVIDAMVARGLVRREAAPDDARARVVVLTPLGLQLLSVVEDVYRELEGEWAAVIGADALDRMRRDMSAVLRARPAELRAHSVGSPPRGGSSTG